MASQLDNSRHGQGLIKWVDAFLIYTYNIHTPRAMLQQHSIKWGFDSVLAQLAQYMNSLSMHNNVLSSCQIVEQQSSRIILTVLTPQPVSNFDRKLLSCKAQCGRLSATVGFKHVGIMISKCNRIWENVHSSDIQFFNLVTHEIHLK